MRCPHCGYVTFDHVSTCRRCAKPFPATPRHASVSPIVSPRRVSSAGPHFPPAAAAVQEQRVRLEEGFLLEGDIREEELDLSRFSLPEELQGRNDAEIEWASLPICAGFFGRAAAVLVDAPILLVLTVLAMTLAALAAVGGGTVAGEVTRQIELLASGTAIVAAFGVSLGYHVLWWGQGGQTPGKMLMGLQVVRKDGKKIGYGRAFLRWVGYCIALLPLGGGFVMVLFHPRKRGLHDLLAGTCVVRVYFGAGQ